MVQDSYHGGYCVTRFYCPRCKEKTGKAVMVIHIDIHAAAGEYRPVLKAKVGRNLGEPQGEINIECCSTCLGDALETIQEYHDAFVSHGFHGKFFDADELQKMLDAKGFPYNGDLKS